ncbi:MAG: glycosyltransferase family 1 protein [Phycisphaerales bacterium]|nr:MAG: glycosyltransferase family 1 protein [Phycisphaerales bacterium]
MKIALLTDAWLPQVNGVVRTLGQVRHEVEKLGHDMLVVHPDLFNTFPCPRYAEIRLSVLPGRVIADLLDQEQPDAIHIATEGPIGLAGRKYCVKRNLPFTTSYHTKFPEYVQAFAHVPPRWTYAMLRWFHVPAARTLVPTASMKRELVERGFDGIRVWTRGVDTELFKPYGKEPLDHLPRPIFVYFGRVSREKNIESFLKLDLPGTKYVIGDGPARKSLEKKFPNAVFAGYMHGETLARHIAASDVFVFPSRTDTFGVVMLEALACGVPVAAYPVTGPIDVITTSEVGILDEDLRDAAERAMKCDPNKCRTYALGYSWLKCAEIFLETLAPISSRTPVRTG